MFLSCFFLTSPLAGTGCNSVLFRDPLSLLLTLNNTDVHNNDCCNHTITTLTRHKISPWRDAVIARFGEHLLEVKLSWGVALNDGSSITCQKWPSINGFSSHFQKAARVVPSWAN